MSEVIHGGVHAPGRSHSKLKGGSFEFQTVVGPHFGFRKICNDRGIRFEGTVAHPHGIEHRGFQILREGLMVGHPDMPTFRFTREDARGFVLYLRSIQAP